jgi:hypothetical protein
MRKLSEYQAHAEECRKKIAASMKNAKHKKQLQQMAETWEMLARDAKATCVKRLILKRPPTEAPFPIKIGIAGNAPDFAFAVCDTHRATVTLRAIFIGHVADYPRGKGQGLGVVA